MGREMDHTFEASFTAIKAAVAASSHRSMLWKAGLYALYLLYLIQNTEPGIIQIINYDGLVICAQQSHYRVGTYITKSTGH
jgi:hypothetical protein